MTVPRALLWQIMGHIGVPQRSVQAVRSMYTDVVCRVRVAGCASPIFESTIGVKQGCPLSPTLFGTFIDRLYFRIASRLLVQGQACPRAGVCRCCCMQMTLFIVLR